MKFHRTQQHALEVYADTFMQKILDKQDELEQIYVDAMKTSPERQIVINRASDKRSGQTYVVERSCMRRGWKIVYTPVTGIYELLRTNTSDYYKHATDKEVERFAKNGWLRSCDEIQVERDRKRLAKFNRKIDNANSQRNDSLMVHWRKRRMELIDNISSIEESLSKRNGQAN